MWTWGVFLRRGFAAYVGNGRKGQWGVCSEEVSTANYKEMSNEKAPVNLGLAFQLTGASVGMSFRASGKIF